MVILRKPAIIRRPAWFGSQSASLGFLIVVFIAYEALIGFISFSAFARLRIGLIFSIFVWQLSVLHGMFTNLIILVVLIILIV